jgi:hypothetical protein
MLRDRLATSRLFESGEPGRPSATREVAKAGKRAKGGSESASLAQRVHASWQSSYLSQLFLTTHVFYLS